jgi:hypothetical protein
MSTMAAISLTVGLVAVGFAVLTWLTSRAERKRRAESAFASERFRKRIESPDLEALERHFGHPLSASLRALYADRRLIMSQDVVVAVANPLERSKDSYIAWFEPADAEALGSPMPGCEGLFPFAGNGAGDQFLVNPTHPDPEVLYYLHETGEKASLGVPLSAFMAAPRGPLPDD